MGDDWLGKKVDHFLLGEDLSKKLSIFRHWVGEGGLSDHFPILLETKGTQKKLGSPFKFNSSWLVDDSFVALFHSTWRRIGSEDGERLSRSKTFMNNLTRLKAATKNWVIQKSLKEDEELRAINVELDLLEDPEGGGYAILASRDRIQMLEADRRRILQVKEESWRLKSRAIWLQARDENTKFFQQYANGRKN